MLLAPDEIEVEVYADDRGRNASPGQVVAEGAEAARQIQHGLRRGRQQAQYGQGGECPRQRKAVPVVVQKRGIRGRQFTEIELEPIFGAELAPVAVEHVLHASLDPSAKERGY